VLERPRKGGIHHHGRVKNLDATRNNFHFIHLPFPPPRVIMPGFIFKGLDLVAGWAEWPEWPICPGNGAH
jgi:hypothetical protein